jgi:transaldolase
MLMIIQVTKTSHGTKLKVSQDRADSDFVKQTEQKGNGGSGSLVVDKVSETTAKGTQTM